MNNNRIKQKITTSKLKKKINNIKINNVYEFIKIVKEHYNETKDLIDNKKTEFLKFQNETEDNIFKELCFCILAANFSAEGSLRIQQLLDNKLITLNEEELANALKNLHRFPNTRARYIIEARKLKHEIWKKIQELKKELKEIKDLESKNYEVKNTESKRIKLKEFRAWLVKNVKGLGMKEASHFLRNIGFFDFAIIDYHIIDLLYKFNIIERPKTLTKTKYLEIETILRRISEKVNLPLGLLDLVLWHLETGKIIK